MTNYRRGKRAEDKTKRWLEADGYTVISSRGSHGAVDLVAISAQCVLVIQVKSGRKLSRVEWATTRDALRRVPVPSNGLRWLVTWTPYAREPEIEEI